MTTSFIAQVGFRGRGGDTVPLNDNTTWVAAENTNFTIDAGETFRLRLEADEQNAKNGAVAGTIEYNHNGGGWVQVTTSSSVLRAVPSSQFNDGAATTNLLTGSARAFVAGEGSEDASPANMALNNQQTEHEYALQIIPADVAQDNTIQVRLIGMDAYTVTPTITVGTVPPPAAYAQVGVGWRASDNDGLNAAYGAGDPGETGTPTLKAERRVRGRFAIKNTGSTGSFTPLIQINDGSGWVSVVDYIDEDPSLMASIPGFAIHVSDQYVDGAATTALLAVTGTFVAGTGQEDNTAPSVSLGQDEYTEIEWCLVFRRLFDNGSYYDHGKTLQVRVTDAGTPLASYTVPCTVTLDMSGGIIGGTYPESSGKFGPYADGNGNIYIICESDELTARPVMNKSIDGGNTFTVVDQISAPLEGDIESGAVVQVGTRLYFLTQPSSVFFDVFATSDDGTSPDQWLVTDEIVKDPNTETEQLADLAGRSDGTFVAFYNNDDICRYKIRSSGGIWGTEQTVDTEAVTWGGVAVVVGENDVTYIFYRDNTNGTIYYRTLSAGDVLSGRTVVATGLDTGSAYRGGMLPAIYHDDSGVEVITVVYQLADDTLQMRQLRDGVLQAAEAITTEAVDSNSLAGRQPEADIVEYNGDLYCVYTDDATQDLWIRTRPAGGSWGAPAELIDGAYIDQVRANVITHSAGNGGATMIAMYVCDTPDYHPSLAGNTGDGLYYEYELAAGGGATVNLVANVVATTVTPAASLAVSRSFAAGAVAASSTPDTAALSIARELAATVASASSTPDTASLAVTRALSSIIAGASSTPETVALTVQRALVAGIAPASLTPDAGLVVTRSLVAGSLGVSATPDNVSLLAVISLSAAVGAVSATPDSASLAVQRALSATIAAGSQTPAGTLSVQRAIAAGIVAASTTPDTVVLNTGGVIVSLSALIAAVSATPDNAGLIVSRNLSAGIVAASSTPAAGLAVARSLAASATPATTTPDNIDLITSLLLAASIAAASNTPAIPLAVTRQVVAAPAGQSNTGAALLQVARDLTASPTGTSATGDISLGLALLLAVSINPTSTTAVVALMLTGIQGKVAVSISALAPAVSVSGSKPGVSFLIWSSETDFAGSNPQVEIEV